jgi:hypothetical protein
LVKFFGGVERTRWNARNLKPWHMLTVTVRTLGSSSHRAGVMMYVLLRESHDLQFVTPSIAFSTEPTR